MPKISALPPMTTADAADEAPIVDTSVSTTKKWTLTLLLSYLQSLTSWLTTAMYTNASVTPDKWTNPYRFRASRNAAANTGGAGAFAKITFDTEQYDINNNFATGTYTAPLAGAYHFSYRAKWVTGGIEQYQSALYKNGAAISLGTNEMTAAIEHATTQGSDTILLAANDTIDVYVTTSGGAKALEVGATACYLAGFLVSKT